MESQSHQSASTIARIEETCTHLKTMRIQIQEYRYRETELRQKVKEQQKLITQLNIDIEQLRNERCAAQNEASLVKGQSDQLQVTIKELNQKLATERSDASSQIDQAKNELLKEQEDNKLQQNQLRKELCEASKKFEAQANQFEDEKTRIRKDAEEKTRQMEESCREQVAERVARERSDSANSAPLHSPSTFNQRISKQQLRTIVGQANAERGKWSTQVRECTGLETKVRLEREAVDNVIERYRQDYGPYEDLPSCTKCLELKAQFASLKLEWKALRPDITVLEKSLHDQSTQLTGSRPADVGATLGRLTEKATRCMDAYLPHLGECLHSLMKSRCRVFYDLVKQRGGVLSLARPRQPQGGQLTPSIRFDPAGKTVFIAEESRSSLTPESVMRPYVFDGVLDPSDSNEVLWADYIQPLIENSFGGLDVTLLAYGQTGSGKTYTMCENANSMVAKTIQRVFERMDYPEAMPKPCESPIKTRVESPDGVLRGSETNNSESDKQIGGQGAHYRVDVSVFEIYRNKPYTLVGERAPIEFRAEKDQSGLDQYTPYYCDHGRKSHRVNSVIVQSKEDCMRVFEEAVKRRSRRDMTVHGTGLNSESSRSHMVCTLHLELTTRDNRQTDSYIQLVDLAGSERIVTAVANPSKKKEIEEAREEGKTIMTSLSNLLDLLKNLHAGRTITKGMWTSSMINTALYPGMSRPSPLIAFMACMRTEIPGGKSKAQHKEEKEFIDEVRRTCREGSRLIGHEDVTGIRSRATSAAGRSSQMSNRRAN